MLNAVTEVLTGPASLERLEAKRAEAMESLDAARAKYREACLDAETGDDAAGRRKTAATKDLERAEARVRDLAEAIEAARVRDTQRAQREAEAERQRRWDLALEYASDRMEAAKDAEKAAQALFDAFTRLARVSIDMRNACPGTLSDAAALLMPPDLQNVLRLELVRAGFPWAASWPWGAHTLPALTKRIEDANAYARRLRREAAK